MDMDLDKAVSDIEKEAAAGPGSESESDYVFDSDSSDAEVREGVEGGGLGVEEDELELEEEIEEDGTSDEEEDEEEEDDELDSLDEDEDEDSLQSSDIDDDEVDGATDFARAGGRNSRGETEEFEDDDDEYDDDDDELDGDFSLSKAISKAKSILGRRDLKLEGLEDTLGAGGSNAKKTSKKSEVQKGPKGEDFELEDSERQRLQDVYSGKGRNFRKRRRVGKNKTFKQKNVSEEALEKQGEANMLYAVGDYAKAAEVLVEVVKIAPSLHDSYHTLGLVHEALGNKEKAIGFLMIAANLSPKDHDLWSMLSDKCEELEFWEQAVYCLTRTIKTADSKNPKLHWRRATCFDELGATKKAMKDLETVEQLVSSDENASADVKIFLSRLYEKSGKHDKALSVLMEQSNSDEGDTTCVPKLVLCKTDLCIKQRLFFDALKIIEDCLAYSNSNQPDKRTRLQLHANAAIAAIQLKDEEQAKMYLERVYSEEDCDDPEVFLKIADMFYLVGDVESALKFYQRLIGHEGYDEIPLKIKIAECQQSMNKIDDAAENYSTILSKLSITKLEYLEVSILLAELLQQSPDSERALQTLDSLGAIPRLDLEKEPNPMTKKKLFELYIREAKLNLQYKKREERFLELMLPLLFYGWKENQDYSAKRREEKKARAKGGRKTAVYRVGGKRKRAPKSDVISTPVAGESELFNLTMECCKVLIETKNLQKMDELLTCAVEGLKSMKPKSRRSAFRFLRAILDSHKGQHESALTALRTLCTDHPSSNILWNFFFQVAKDAGKASACGRYLSHLKNTLKRDNLHVMLASAHHLFYGGKHRNALLEYISVYKRCPDNPLVALCIAVTCLQYALNIKDEKRNMLILKTFCFIEEYTKLKESCPGALYNFGRTYHQLGLIHFAQTFYNKSLQLIEKKRGEETTTQLSSNSESKSELRVIECSAAHNLAIIYCSTGAQELASEVLRKHASL